MQLYEIRQLCDGSIDYNNYVARPVSLLTPNMRRFSRQAVSAKFLLLMAATVAALVLIPIVAADRAVGERATTRIQSGAEATAAIADLQRQLGETTAVMAMR